MFANVDKPAVLPKAKILLIDDDEAEYHLVNELLREQEALFDLQWVNSLQQGMDRLSQGGVDVVLLDLFLGDSRGLDSFKRVKAQFKDVPIVILSGLNDEKSAVEAIQEGAQDFLVKDHVEANRLSRVIQFAIKRHESQKDPKNIGLIDSFTGLYNRHGFLMLAEQQVKAAQRTKKGFFVCFAVLNDLAGINEIHGKAEGDHAVLMAAEILRESFRSTDLIARMGTDKFAVLTSDQGSYSPKVISSRIRNNQKYYNAQFNRYRLSLSMCASHFDPVETLTVNDLSAKADHVFANYESNSTSNLSIL